MLLQPILTLFHLLGFAAFVGAVFAQHRLMTMSGRDGLPSVVRDEYERLSAALVTKVEVPAAFAQVLTGLGFIALAPALLHQHWLHGKLTVVAVLLVVSHLEMFNARRLLKARAAGAAAEIAARKKRHAAFGVAQAVLVGAILLLVTVLRAVLLP